MVSVAFVVFLRYRTFKIIIPMIITMFSEILIILGVASAVIDNVPLVAASIGMFADPIDSDHDELTDSYELSIGTDPHDPDTDNDRIRDDTPHSNRYIFLDNSTSLNYNIWIDQTVFVNNNIPIHINTT